MVTPGSRANAKTSLNSLTIVFKSAHDPTMDPFKEVAAGAREALEDMTDPASWTVVFVAREDRGYRLLVAYRGEWLRTLIRGSVDVAPSPRVAARNLVGSFLDGVAREHGQPGRRPIYEDEYVRASAFPLG
jgi:hypothetical protein